MDRKWWTLVAVCVATFMLLLDITIVNVALPEIERALHASFSDLQWVIDAYALTLAAPLLTAGSLADLFGRRLVFLLGIGLFTVASLLCALAGSPLVLNLARALQGVGGALMFATSLALLASAFQGRDRGTAFGVWGATTARRWPSARWSAACSPTASAGRRSSSSTSRSASGRSPLTLAKVDESRDPHEGTVDFPGLVTFSGALVLLIFGLIRGNDEGWTSGMIVAMLVGAVVLLALFVAIELHREHPMLDLSLFRKRAFNGASIAAFVLSASMFSMFLYITLYIQNILGYTALEAGLRFLPITLLSFAFAPVSGKLAERFGVRWFIGGGSRWSASACC